MVRTWASRRSKYEVTYALVILGVAALVASTLPLITEARPISDNRGLGEPLNLVGTSHVEVQALLLEYPSCETALDNDDAAGETSRSSMELEQNTAPTSQPTAAPSLSPSLAIQCSNPFSNARGSYTSSKAPCVITFHNEDEGEEQLNPLGANRKRYHPHSDEASSSYYHGTSNVCETDNKIGEAKEYVSGWPDECVGDFARCYDLRDPNYRMCEGLRTILKGLNDDLRKLKEDNKKTSYFLPWKTNTRDLQDGLFPPGTTHMSVDCTSDKDALLESYQQAMNFQHDMIEEKISATKRQTLFVVVSVLVAVLIVVYAISLLVVQPIVGAIGDAAGNNRQRDGNSRRNGSLGSLVSRTRGLRIETADGYDSDEADEEEEGERQHVQIDLQFVDEPQDVASNNNNNNNTMIVAQSQQIPMDFDAVPIVPATIIPFEAIHAEVMEDGVIYYP